MLTEKVVEFDLGGLFFCFLCVCVSVRALCARGKIWCMGTSDKVQQVSTLSRKRKW